ncbi:MAG: hypothetical protein K2Y40_02590 [Reyranella sp.]|jgi:hypothetical protein|nr:hypothetical protein [Reyranella sp.]
MAKIMPLPRDRITYRHRSQFAVIVVCADERDQRNVFNQLRRLGYRLRVVTV